MGYSKASRYPFSGRDIRDNMVSTGFEIPEPPNDGTNPAQARDPREKECLDVRWDQPELKKWRKSPRTSCINLRNGKREASGTCTASCPSWHETAHAISRSWKHTYCDWGPEAWPIQDILSYSWYIWGHLRWTLDVKRSNDDRTWQNNSTIVLTRHKDLHEGVLITMRTLKG